MNLALSFAKLIAPSSSASAAYAVGITSSARNFATVAGHEAAGGLEAKATTSAARSSCDLGLLRVSASALWILNRLGGFAGGILDAAAKVVDAHSVNKKLCEASAGFLMPLAPKLFSAHTA